MNVAGLARRDTPLGQPVLFPGTLDVERTVAFDLGETIAVQGVRFLEELTVQVNTRVPLGQRAAAARHYTGYHASRHQRWCEYDACPSARDWLTRPIRGPALTVPLASA